jgi:hypothetical protein
LSAMPAVAMSLPAADESVVVYFCLSANLERKIYVVLTFGFH